ncbi:sorting nexin-16-like [Thunnus albacares]|uniref:sorting nexin-16-like n=1 Tax=Thunnus albacares TaxID=8236 RepID=UPI001CF6195D|nr:sorting nexin-16-like [Thunnus albacares]XP_044223168.1 sorting nexin-16-like [Thunnus albacares]
MAAPFVPVPFPVDRTAAYRSWIKRGSPIHTSTSSTDCEPSPLESIPWVRGVGPWGTTGESQSRPQGGVLDGSPSLLEGEGGFWKNWVERPITPTLLGYEILEERAKFTVYKILVTGSEADSWVIFRRYTDFCRLNDKLKELFPGFHLALPPKRWFKDNYDEEFLEERQIGLQTFLQNLTVHKDIISSGAVRHFLCLVDPPSPFDSLEESRAFCETLEETNHRLQRELLEKQREVDTLKKTLEERENHISLLAKKVRISLSLSSESFEHLCEPPATVATDTHREGDTDVTEEVDDGRGFSIGDGLMH